HLDAHGLGGARDRARGRAGASLGDRGDLDLLLALAQVLGQRVARLTLLELLGLENLLADAELDLAGERLALEARAHLELDPGLALDLLVVRALDRELGHALRRLRHEDGRGGDRRRRESSGRRLGGG